MDSQVGARHFIPKFMEHLGVTPLHFILENLFYSYKMVSGTTPPVWEHRWRLCFLVLAADRGCFEESGYHILREALWLCPAIGDCPTCMNSQHPLLDVLLPSGKASRDIQGEKWPSVCMHVTVWFSVCVCVCLCVCVCMTLILLMLTIYVYVIN